MTVTFKLRFHTHDGQSLFLTGNHPALGANRVEDAIPLRYLNAEFWQVTVDFPAESPATEPIVFNYILRDADGTSVQDLNIGRCLKPAELANKTILVIDSWNDASALENVFYTDPFKNVLFPSGNAVKPPAPVSSATHTFSVKAPFLKENETLCLMGNCRELGNWNTAQPLLLERGKGGENFTARVDLRHAAFPLHYKYGTFDRQEKKFAAYEAGENRTVWDSADTGQYIISNDGYARFPFKPWRGAGIAIPVFSLRTKNGFGVGEFADLMPLADWCQKTGLKLIQILPINDTSATQTWSDSYPYAAISAFALHPLYLNLADLMEGKDKKLPPPLVAEQARLNALEAVDYEAVMSAKLSFARKIFTRQKKKTFAGKEYEEFFARNENWLSPYAAFCALRDKFATPDFNRWPVLKKYDEAQLATLLAQDEQLHTEIEFHCFVQFHLHLQLRGAVSYAHSKGIVLKGDIAIGVYKHSADVWQNPGLFHTDQQAGAPPDAFSVKGQNWGFPTYNWPRMAADNYLWWQQRFEQMSGYFDAFRIDHILGFFRIWSSPADAVEGILGVFAPAIPVAPEEFGQWGIFLDRNRFLQPFINEEIVGQVFGEQAGMVKKQFLDLATGGALKLKPEFASQQKVENHFDPLPASPENLRLKLGLFDLISNKILLETTDANGVQLHFRFGMEETWSFKYLDEATRKNLKALYVDYFFRRQESLWMREGLKKLPALKRVTNALICGEDLGMVPECVPKVMRQLALLSLEIQRMPKAIGAEFSRPSDAPYLSVVTPSTHDMSTIRGWWAEDQKLSQKFYNVELGFSGEAPGQCTEAINQKIVEQHLASPAMWSIFQLQDLLGMDGGLRRRDFDAERINVPANPKNYWRYRMHLDLEQLNDSGKFNDLLKELVRQHRPLLQ